MIIGLKSAVAILRRKKFQSILVGLTIMLTALLIYIGLSLMNLTNPFDKMYTRANGSENLLFLNTKIHDTEDIKSWLGDHESIEGVSEYIAHKSNIEFLKNDEKTSITIFLTEFEEFIEQDKVYITENKKATSPKDGEIYISYYFAHNNQLEIGDVVKVRADEHTFELVVSELIVDPQFSNGFMSPSRCFVASDFFQKKGISSDISLLGIKYKTYTPEKETALKKEFDNYMFNSIQPTFIKYAEIDASYNTIGKIIAAALLLTSIFMFIIVVFIIRATVRNEILQQYKTIGVRKVIGYSSKQIRQMFLYMYIIIGVIASSIGVFLGLPVRRFLVQILTNDLQVGDNTTLDWYFVITIIIILGLLIIFVSIAANKSNKIRPIQAIKYGMPENKLKGTKFRVDHFKNVPLCFIIAIKQILMNKRKTLASIVSIMIITFVSLTISNISGSMSNARHLSKSLIGITAGDVSVTYSSDMSSKEVINKLESIENVERVLFSTINLSESTLSKDGTENIPLLVTTIYGDAFENLIILSEGRQPLNNNEIVVSALVAQKAGKTIGDYIVIKKEEGDKKYLISGIYNSIYHSSLSYVMVEKHIPEEQKHVNGIYWVYMETENVIMEDIEESITDVLGDTAIVDEFGSDAQEIINTVKSFPTVTNMILGIFIIVCGIIIFNWTIIDITHSVKTYGILKATGFSNSELRVLLISKSVILTLIGIISGYVLCALTVDKVMVGMLSLTPFSTIKLPVVFSHNQGLLIALLYCLIALIATLIPTKRIASISPKNLIAE
ncbi:FtsX-like permease family protein [Mycoplasmatota bacterium]|nr:FtsX-like permease family protein [Mycoplasmatota bacterium]